MIVDIQQLAGWVVSLSAVAGVIIAAYKIVDKHLLKRLEKLESRMTALETWTSKQQEDIADVAIRGRITIDGVLACLYGLQEKGCNGAVTKAIEDINGYVNGKAYKTTSRQKSDKPGD